MSAPILAVTGYAVRRWLLKHRVELRLFGGLRVTGAGALPRFFVECEHRENGRVVSRGPHHAEIVRRFPGFADLAALNLSDIDGLPIHAVGNGWYWLAGATRGGHGESYHGGGSLRRKLRADGNLENEGYPPQDECLAAFADYVRIPIAEARRVRDSITSRAAFAEWIEGQKPRFKAEADACRLKHDLITFGDPNPSVTMRPEIDLMRPDRLALPARTPQSTLIASSGVIAK